MHSGLESPEGTWWMPAHRTEKVWVAIAFVWCMVLFAMMPVMHARGGQNLSGIRHTVKPGDYARRYSEFVQQYRVGEDHGFPVVAPPPGSDIYLMATSFAWLPVLKLEKGAQYTLHLSSIDVNHGFSLLPVNVNVQVVPGYDYGIPVTPTAAGDFRIVCNEFCGIGHHTMVGKVIVTDGARTVVNTAPTLRAGGDS
jgi:cytochrome c oxidase subunit II